MKLWTTLEEKKLRELFPVYKTRDVAKMMGRTYRSVRDKAYDLGLVKEFDFRDLWLPGQKPKHVKKGQWPKGCERTWFKKGNAAHEYPIGSEVIRKGEWFVKVSNHRLESGTNWQKFSANWRRKKYIVWERHYGPIPEGRFVCYANGDPTDCRIENLVLMTLSDAKKKAWRPSEAFSESARKGWATRRARAEARV